MQPAAGGAEANAVVVALLEVTNRPAQRPVKQKVLEKAFDDRDRARVGAEVIALATVTKGGFAGGRQVLQTALSIRKPEAAGLEVLRQFGKPMLHLGWVATAVAVDDDFGCLSLPEGQFGGDLGD